MNAILEILSFSGIYIFIFNDKFLIVSWFCKFIIVKRNAHNSRWKFVIHYIYTAIFLMNNFRCYWNNFPDFPRKLFIDDFSFFVKQKPRNKIRVLKEFLTSFFASYLSKDFITRLFKICVQSSHSILVVCQV